jgi:hypothetical protein
MCIIVAVQDTEGEFLFVGLLTLSGVIGAQCEVARVVCPSRPTALRVFAGL